MTARPVTRAVGALLPAEIRVFRVAELAAARAWVRGEAAKVG